MARTVTLATLRGKVLTRAGMENTQSPSTANVNDIIADAYAAYYDLVRSCYGQDYFMSNSSFSTVSGTANYTLPADFAALLGVDVQVGGVFYTMRPYELIERNMFSNPAVMPTGVPMRYRLNSSSISLIPIPAGVYLINLLYVPAPIVLASDSDVMDGVSGWDDYVTWSAVASLLARIESDPSYALSQKAEAEQRIRTLAPQRDAGMPPRVSDASLVVEGRWPWA